MSDTLSPVQQDPGVRPAPPGPEARSRLESVLHILAPGGSVSQKMRASAESALSAIPPGEDVVEAFRCSVLSGTSGPDGVALLTAERLSVFERRGLRSPDQKLVVPMAKPFSVEHGPGATQVTLAPAGGRRVTLELFDADRAESFRDELGALSSARQEGWWSQSSVAWPGWLGAAPTWSYLGGDSRLPRPALNLRLHVGPTGFKFGDADGSTAHLAPWSAVSQLPVLGPEQGLQRAAARTILTAEGFAAAWRSAEWSAFIVLTCSNGEQLFLGTTGLTEAEVRNRLFRVAEAMPSGPRPDAAASPDPAPAPAVAAPAVETPAVETPVVAPAVAAPIVAPAEPEPVAAVAPDRPATGPEPGAYDLAEQLERLAGLHRQGILDDTEFARAKAAVLGR